VSDDDLAADQDDPMQRVEEELAALEAFGTRLDELNETLSPKERAALDAILYRAMGPLDRLRARQAAGLLDPDEQAMLAEIAAEEQDP
jgi:hypothetical protein